MILNPLKSLINFLIFYQIFWQNIKIMVSAFEWNNNETETTETCVGKYQIGIDYPSENDIVTGHLERIEFVDFAKMPYETYLENNGYNLLIKLKYNDTPPTINVNFKRFRLHFLYFEWFEKAAYPFQDIEFPTEIHAIFCDIEHKDIYESLNIQNSIMVLAYSVQIITFETDIWNILKQNLRYVRESNSSHKIPNNSLDYWILSNVQTFNFYEGSLPAFFCNTTVIWVDFEAPLSITPEIIAEFQKLKNFAGSPLMETYQNFSIPKNPVFSNMRKLPKFGSSPPIHYISTDHGGNSRFVCKLSTLIMIILILFLNFFEILY